MKTMMTDNSKWVACWGNATSITNRREAIYAKDSVALSCVFASPTSQVLNLSRSTRSLLATHLLPLVVRQVLSFCLARRQRAMPSAMPLVVAIP